MERYDQDQVKYKKIMDDVWDIESNEIKRLCEIDANLLFSLLKTLGNCTGRILTTGCGTSGVAAKKIAHTLCCIERPSVFLTPSDAVHGEMGLMQPGDILIMISKGGNTSELLAMIPACKEKKIIIIGVTENQESVLAKQADIWIPIIVRKEPCPFGMLATASTLSVIATFDAISIALMYYTNYRKEQFLVIHPGGAVGERLRQES